MIQTFQTSFLNMQRENKLIIGISGASGAVYGIKLLEILRELKIETHLIISKSAAITINTETDYSPKDVINLADYTYNNSEIGARIASGSFKTDGMIIAPCSMKTLSSIAYGYDESLIARAAGVIIKERRSLSLMVREAPLSSIHLENMLKLSNIGVNICPPVPAFYNKPNSLDDIITHSVIRTLDLHGFETDIIERWDGIK